MELLTITADGNTAVGTWHGGRGTYSAQGTFNSGTVKLQASYDGGITYTNLHDDLSLAAAGFVGFEVAKCLLQIATSGSSSPTIKAGVAPVGYSTVNP